MIAELENIHLALPEMVVLVTAIFALIGDLFLRRYSESIAFFVAIVGLIIAAGISYLYLGNFEHFILYGLYVSNDVAQLMKLFICLTVLLSFIYARHYIDERQIPSGDYYVLGLFSTLGMLVLVSANSLLTVYLGLELLSLPLYALAAMRRTDALASEAAMKYFVMGAIASGLLLYGFSLVYGATGQLNLVEIAAVISKTGGDHATLLSYALVFIVAGIGFKLAAIPFHMWAPDVYQGAPSSVTLFIAAAPKIAALSMALRVLTVGLIGLGPQWQKLLLVLAILSVSFGNTVAVVQTNIKRLFAYSAISHMGYALFGILSLTTAGYAAALYYVLIYAIMTAAAFGLIVILSNNGLEIESINDLKGLNKRNPWLAFMMLIVLLSMAGIPPTVGFFIKLFVLKALVDAHLTWVAVVGLIFAVVGAFYYLRIIKIMYFDKAETPDPMVISKTGTFIYSLNCLALLYFGIFPEALVSAASAAFR